MAVDTVKIMIYNELKEKKEENKMKYTDEYIREIMFPLGGIGTG